MTAARLLYESWFRRAKDLACLSQDTEKMLKSWP